MPRANHPTVLTKKCPLCPNGKWNIRHFNGNEQCTRYASCTCGGQVRADNNQSIFYDNDPVTVIPDPTPPVTGSENEQTQEPSTGNTGNNDEQKENEWEPY